MEAVGVVAAEAMASAGRHGRVERHDGEVDVGDLAHVDPTGRDRGFGGGELVVLVLPEPEPSESSSSYAGARTASGHVDIEARRTASRATAHRRQGGDRHGSSREGRRARRGRWRPVASPMARSSTTSAASASARAARDRRERTWRRGRPGRSGCSSRPRRRRGGRRRCRGSAAPSLRTCRPRGPAVDGRPGQCESVSTVAGLGEPSTTTFGLGRVVVRDVPERRQHLATITRALTDVNRAR